MTPSAFDSSHPLAAEAARSCEVHYEPLVGDVACSRCWERAIRADERFATEFDLPADAPPDPEYIDEIAVELACGGERVVLSAAELVVAANFLRRRGMSPIEIGRRLHISYYTAVKASTPTNGASLPATVPAMRTPHKAA